MLSERTRSNVLVDDGERDALKGGYRRLFRDALFEQLPSERIAALLKTDTERAEREVAGALRLIAKQDRFSWIPREQSAQLQHEVLDMVVGYGPLEALLADPEVTEIMVNGPAKVFYERAGRIQLSDVSFSGTAQVELVIDRILGPLGRHVDEQSPMVSARLPQGYRVNVVIAPIALEGPVITIRKFKRDITSLEELVARGALGERLAQLLGWLIQARFNIAVTGATGSGKTTFLNALSARIPHEERVVTIEDAAELSFSTHPHVVRLEARAKSTEGTGEVTIRELVINALRMRPDRIIVGECRGAEALDMLQAMNTGHDGSLTTLHANSPRDAVSRLEMMSRYAVDLPVEILERQIASALDIIVHLERDASGERRVVEVDHVSADARGIVLDPFCRWERASQEHIWGATPWIGRITERVTGLEEEVRRWESSSCA